MSLLSVALPKFLDVPDWNQTVLLSDSSQVQILPLPHTVIQYCEFHHCLCEQSLSFSGILRVLNGLNDAVCFLENIAFI